MNALKTWNSYYDNFSYFSQDSVRPGCEPRFAEQPSSTHAIVLVHGLTDSPYFMDAIGEYFYREMGYSVYLPLLHCHGLKEPRGMVGVDQLEWKKNVQFAVKTAAAKHEKVSIGGLSTGGTLSFFFTENEPLINGSLYLFSACLDIGGILGDLKEWLLRSLVFQVFNSEKELIGPNPYRYAAMDHDGARELAEVILETDKIEKQYKINSKKIARPIFAAHSEADETADINGIYRIRDITEPQFFSPYFIPKSEKVSHASLVLKESIKDAKNKELEAPNKHFLEMMAAAKTHAEKHK